MRPQGGGSTSTRACGRARSGPALSSFLSGSLLALLALCSAALLLALGFSILGQQASTNPPIHSQSQSDAGRVPSAKHIPF